jgi:hypothetical protein
MARSVTCPDCTATTSLDDESARTAHCAHCQKSFEIPATQPAETVRAPSLQGGTSTGSTTGGGRVITLVVIAGGLLIFFWPQIGRMLTTHAPSAAAGTPSSYEQPVTSATPTIAPGKWNAERKAEAYLSMGGFSRSGLIKQLEFEGFSAEDSTYAVDNLTVNWDDQAAMKAKAYLGMMGFSHSGLVKQLEFDGFTPEQAQYGASAAGY